MKNGFLIGALGALLLASQGRADVEFGVSGNSNGEGSFYFEVGNYFQVPERDVLFIHERSLPDDELPVCLFLARQAHVEPALIVRRRLAGQSWMKIALGLQLDAGVFYWAVDEPLGPPYDSIYLRFRRPRHLWHLIRLRDAEIVNLVNLRFNCEHYGYRPVEVVRYRREGRHFYQIHKRGWSGYKGAPQQAPKAPPAYDDGGGQSGVVRIDKHEDKGRHEGWDKDKREHRDRGNHFGQEKNGNKGDDDDDDNWHKKGKGRGKH